MGISTHVLDTSRGRPGAGIGVVLSRPDGEEQAGVTDVDGRCRLVEGAVEAGVYRLRFATADYFAGLGVTGFYPWVEIAFEVRVESEHHHVPLLLTACGFTTYRGS
jgi:5-hydroxyisourate hydrolase